MNKKETLQFSSAFFILHSSRVIFMALLHWNLYQFMFYCLARKYARNIIMFVTNRPTARYYGLTYNKFTRNKCRSSHYTKDEGFSLDLFWNRIFGILSEKRKILGISMKDVKTLMTCRRIHARVSLCGRTLHDSSS